MAIFANTAFDVWKSEEKPRGIVTLCKELDIAIGDGIPIGCITQLVGAPGCGKTQLCLQLCVNVQIPTVLSGFEAAAVFIDTNRGFSTDRLREISIACVKHCTHIISRHCATDKFESFTVDAILDNVYCAICMDHIDLLAFVVNLRKFIKNNPKIRLIVIDSLSYVFRFIESSVNRTRMICELLIDLQKLATDFQCAIVITNELTTKIIDSNQTHIVPALGDSFSHLTNYQIGLGRDLVQKELFYASIDKSYYTKETIVPFKITSDGVHRI